MSRERKRRQGVFLAVCLADGNDTGAAYVCCRLLCGGGFLKYYFLLLMFLYDFIRAFRMKVKHGRVWILIEDWLFWLLAAFFVFPMIFTLNHGLIRSFFVIALTLGVFLYRTLVKTHVQRVIYEFFRLIFRPYVWIFKKIKGIQKKHLKS